MVKEWLYKYFDLSKREFNGLMSLAVILIVVMAAPEISNLLFPYQHNVAAENLAIQELELENSEPYPHAKKADGQKTGDLDFFDPNTIGLDGWQKLGLSEKQARVILNYRDKGGKFRNPDDLKKMYSISRSKYAELLPYIRMETVTAKTNYGSFGSTNKAYLAKKSDPEIIEVNGADTLLLDKIKGVGPVFARRIIKYRDRLGGFYKKEQLMEVFGLDSVKFDEIKNQVDIDVSLLRRININSAVVEDFKNHPYIRYKQVNALIQYRKQHGNYTDIEDLKKVAILTPELIVQLKPYLSFK
ncbi:helix-hairpin-helix domain-containing protein [Pedobacter sp. MC2016-14]|uniref:ComEA family DNA-binding protein n=1 Tax=Pedobacter sp. MC2016-14 TaxID=2897327 RepID=UPI001E3F4FF5|nr:helix-hairpin-helix domain-containing protein [Pedobacter sp. MC2016-14]MCD0490317.1 helix-hairpin-helix domain-containing protein [Pedobacter sp. MC2016-14]